MIFIIGIIVASFLYLLLLSFLYFLFLLINEILVIAFNVDPLKWLKREVFEPAGRGLLELIHRNN